MIQLHTHTHTHTHGLCLNNKGQSKELKIVNIVKIFKYIKKYKNNTKLVLDLN